MSVKTPDIDDNPSTDDDNKTSHDYSFYLTKEIIFLLTLPFYARMIATIIWYLDNIQY